MTDRTAKPGSIAGVGADEIMGLIGAGWKRLERLDAISRMITERLQQERQAEVELGIALLKSPTPLEAYLLSTRWLSEQTLAWLQDGPRMAALWAELYVGRSAPAPPLGEWT